MGAENHSRQLKDAVSFVSSIYARIRWSLLSRFFRPSSSTVTLHTCVGTYRAITSLTAAAPSPHGDHLTGNRHNPKGNTNDSGEPDPGPYWRRMHRDWRFWLGAVFMALALTVYILSGNLAWIPRGR